VKNIENIARIAVSMVCLIIIGFSFGILAYKNFDRRDEIIAEEVIKDQVREKKSYAVTDNQGIRNAQGIYFKVVDSDDWLDIDSLKRVMDKIRTAVKTEKVVSQPAKKSEPEQPQNRDISKTGDPELDKLIEYGHDSVAKLQQINDDIPDFKLSAKLKQIEILTAAIFDQVEKKPEMIKEVRQFMNYYLPTTIRLLEQYVQLQNVGMRGENISAGMDQIEAMLDKVIVAFQKQLDSLFERDVIDITADIQVMEQMMASQGLTEDSVF